VKFSDFVFGIIATVMSFFQRGKTPTKPQTDNLTTLIAWMNANEIDLGPMPGTGGVIHKDTTAMTLQIAQYILKLAKSYNLGFDTYADRIAIMVAWIRSESDFDPKAQDPNDQSLAKNATALQIIQNSDLGIAQFSYRTLIALPDFKGMSPDQIVTQAEDPEWATNEMFDWCNDLMMNAKAAFLADPNLADQVPNGDFRILGIQAYNSGLNGAISMARDSGLKGNWAYALSVLAKFNKLEPLFVSA
jgi:hypothetical protein